MERIQCVRRRALSAYSSAAWAALMHYMHADRTQSRAPSRFVAHSSALRWLCVVSERDVLLQSDQAVHLGKGTCMQFVM